MYLSPTSWSSLLKCNRESEIITRTLACEDHRVAEARLAWWNNSIAV